MKHNVVFGLIYTIVYFPLAFWAVNAEATGPIIFLAPALTWILVLVAIFLSKRLSDFRNKTIFITLMLVHYVVTALAVVNAWDDQFPRIIKMIDYGDGWYLCFLLAWYTGGQVLIWTSLFRENVRQLNGY
jgi:Na+/alanine symporter